MLIQLTVVTDMIVYMKYFVFNTFIHIFNIVIYTYKKIYAKIINKIKLRLN